MIDHRSEKLKAHAAVIQRMIERIIVVFKACGAERGILHDRSFRNVDNFGILGVVQVTDTYIVGYATRLLGRKVTPFTAEQISHLKALDLFAPEEVRRWYLENAETYPGVAAWMEICQLLRLYVLNVSADLGGEV